MNELPLIGSSCLRKDLWDRHELNCNSLERNVWRKVVSTSKETILVRDHRLFTAVLKEMGVGNNDTRVVQGFV